MPNSNAKLKLKHLWEQGPGVSRALCSLRILRIGQISSEYYIHFMLYVPLRFYYGSFNVYLLKSQPNYSYSTYFYFYFFMCVLPNMQHILCYMDINATLNYFIYFNPPTCKNQKASFQALLLFFRQCRSQFFV